MPNYEYKFDYDDYSWSVTKFALYRRAVGPYSLLERLFGMHKWERIQEVRADTIEELEKKFKEYLTLPIYYTTVTKSCACECDDV